MTFPLASKKRIRVLVVDDSPVAREFLTSLVESDPELEALPPASNGHEAVQAVEKLRPDVVTMDINMPRMNGFEATEIIMQKWPTPIIIVSASWSMEEVRTTFNAIEAGAVAVLPRPHGVGHPNFEAESRELLLTVKSMSEVKLVRRRAPRDKDAANGGPSKAVPTVSALMERGRFPSTALVVLGASTGGPIVLQTILTRLPKDLPVPVVIVQHMAAGFVDGFVHWLHDTSGFPTHVAKHDEIMKAGNAYVAPDGHHLNIVAGLKMILNRNPPEAGLRPAVSQLFRSAAGAYGPRAMAVLLNGMGVDGAQEMKELKDLGAPTIAQDKESSVVFGMPGEAIRLGGHCWIMAPANIGEFIGEFVLRQGTHLEKTGVY
ncbi:chemotaxis response regulator protein-glutamate methylesterase [soil metagenome]